MKTALAPFSKAIAGVIGTVTVSLGTAMADGDLTSKEAIVALGAGLVIGGGLVYAAPKNAG
jgi:hypothetical protein